MTAGIAAHTALNSAWITRALAGAAYTDVGIAEPWVTVNTEAESVRIIIRDDHALLCFTSVVSVGHGALAGGAVYESRRL